jgi:hypothetical protein
MMLHPDKVWRRGIRIILLATLALCFVVTSSVKGASTTGRRVSSPGGIGDNSQARGFTAVE